MLDRDKTVLVVIDFQEKLLPTIPVTDEILPKAIKLIRFAQELGIPILWTEQYPRGLGRTVPEIAAELESMTAIEKTSFGCMGDAGFARPAGLILHTRPNAFAYEERDFFNGVFCVGRPFHYGLLLFWFRFTLRKPFQRPMKIRPLVFSRGSCP